MKTSLAQDTRFETGHDTRLVRQWIQDNSTLVDAIKTDDFRDPASITAESLAQHPIIRRALEEKSQEINAKNEKGPHIIEETDWVSVHARTKAAKDLIMEVANGRPNVSGLEILANRHVQQVLAEAQTRYESHKGNPWYKATNPASIVSMLILIKTPMEVGQLTSICQEYLSETAPKKLIFKK